MWDELRWSHNWNSKHRIANACHLEDFRHVWWRVSSVLQHAGLAVWADKVEFGSEARH